METKRCNFLQRYDFSNIQILGSGQAHGVRFICIIILFLLHAVDMYLYDKISYFGATVVTYLQVQQDFHHASFKDRPELSSFAIF